MSEHKEPIPSMIYNASVGGHVTNSQQIIDENENKEQSKINAEVKQILGQGESVDNRISKAKNDIIGNASSNGNTLKKIEDRISPLESAVGSGGNIDSRIAAVKSEIKGTVTSACDTLGKAEVKINTNTVAISTESSRAQTAEEQLRVLYNNLQQSQPIPVTELPSIGETGKIYRLAGTTNYSDYIWNGAQFVKMATYDNAIDNKPIEGSENLVKSGGIFESLNDLNTAITTETARATAEEQKIIIGIEQLFKSGYINYVYKGEIIDFTVVNNNTYVHSISEVEDGDVAIITATTSGGVAKPYTIVNSEGVVIDYNNTKSIYNERIIIPKGGTKLIVNSYKSDIHSCYIIKKQSTKDVIDSAYSISNDIRELVLKGTILPMRRYNSCLMNSNGSFYYNNSYSEYTTYLYDLSNYIGKNIFIEAGDKVVSTTACKYPFVIVKDYLNVALTANELHDQYTFESNGLFRTIENLSYNVTEKCYLYVQAYPNSLPNVVVREYSSEQLENVYKSTKIVEHGITKAIAISSTLEKGVYILSVNFKEVSKGWRYSIDNSQIFKEVNDDSIRISFEKDTYVYIQIPYNYMFRDENDVVIGGNVVFSIDKLVNGGEFITFTELDSINSEVSDLKDYANDYVKIYSNPYIIQGWLPNRMTGTLGTFSNMCYTADLGYKLSELKKEEINKVQRVFLFDFLDDDCINADTGVIDEERVYNNIKSCLPTLGIDGLFYYLKLGGYWSTEYTSLSYKVSGSSTDTEEGAYCFFPRNVYKYLYSIGATYEINNYYNPSNKVVMINPDSDYVRNVFYDTILRLFSLFFNEEVVAPALSSENNEIQYTVKRGDFINIIGIHFFGMYGEGGFANNAYPNVSNDGMIGIVEMYKKHLYNYWLVAPIDGKNATGNKYGLDKFQYYIMTSTYGNTVTDSNGMYYGEKGIGLLNGHVNWDLNDCSLYKEELNQKYKNSVLSGENAESESNQNNLLEKIYQRVMDKHYSAFILRWDGVTQTPQYVLAESKKLLGRIGYKLLIVTNIWNTKSQSNAQSTILKGEIVFVNIGSSPCYYEYWKAQIVVREAYTDSILEIIDVPLDQPLIQLTQKCITGDSFSSKDTFSIKLPDIDATKYNGANYNVFLRFIDTHRVSENMFLANKNRTNKGEYCILSNRYIVRFFDNTTYINNPCNGWERTLMFDYEPKEPYKEGYEFVGWYADQELTKKVKSISVNCRQNITLYPKFNLIDWSEIL